MVDFLNWPVVCLLWVWSTGFLGAALCEMIRHATLVAWLSVRWTISTVKPTTTKFAISKVFWCRTFVYLGYCPLCNDINWGRFGGVVELFGMFSWLFSSAAKLNGVFQLEICFSKIMFTEFIVCSSTNNSIADKRLFQAAKGAFLCMCLEFGDKIIKELFRPVGYGRRTDSLKMLCSFEDCSMQWTFLE